MTNHIEIIEKKLESMEIKLIETKKLLAVHLALLAEMGRCGG